MPAKVILNAGGVRSGDTAVPQIMADPKDGLSGWTPILAGEADGTRTLMKVIDWVGGTGDKPAKNLYIGTTGYVAAKADAFNFNAIKRVMSMSAVTNASGVATFDFKTVSPAFAVKPQVIVSSIFTNVVAVTARPKAIAATKDGATVTVEQVGIVGGVVALAVGATVNLIVIEA